MKRWLSNVGPAISKFFFAPASPRPLAVLRITVAATLLLQAILIAPEFFDFFGTNGVLQESLSKYFSEPGTPRMGAVVTFLAKYGFSERTVMAAAGSLYLISLIMLTVGAFTGLSSVVTWFLHWVFMSSSYTTNYGADVFAHIFLFYLMVVPCGAAFSVDNWRKGLPEMASWQARLGLRLVQFHLCIMYLASAVEKWPGPQWHDGEVMWRALNLPVYLQFDFTWLAQYPWLCKLMAWESLAVEGLYFIFIWPKLTRKLWVYLVVALHLGIALFLGLHIFGIIMAALTWSVYGWSATPQKVSQKSEEQQTGWAPQPLGSPS